MTSIRRLRASRPQTLRPLLLLAVAALASLPANAKANEIEDLSIESLLDTEIVTTTRRKERLEGSPGVVTVVTRQQLEEMGARTLMDVLWMIPGFQRVQDNNEILVAARGVFATTNQKILILRDGHRLNEPLFENAEPDYSISLESVQRIEIIRGPGASLYGNAALTAVINLITIDPEDATSSDFTDLRAYGGLYGAWGGSGVYARSWFEGGLLMYGKYATVPGQTVSQTGAEDYNNNRPPAAPDGSPTPVQGTGEMRVDGYDHNFDTGIKWKGKDVTLSASLRRSHYAQGKGNGGQTIDNGTLWHPLEQEVLYGYVDLQITPKWHDIQYTFQHFLDVVNLSTWQLTATPTVAPPEGRLFQLYMQTLRAGVDYSASYTYDLGPAMQGDLLVGAKFENWQMLDSYFLDNNADKQTMVRQKVPLLPEGREFNSAAYIQLNHAFLQQLTLNAGARYDYFEGFGGSFNPRVALVSHVMDGLTLKAIYAQSFQAPSYFYRKSNPGLGYGSTGDLKPEVMRSVQAQAQVVFWKLLLQVGYFYNNVENLISRDNTVTPNVYKNFFGLTVQGVESELRMVLGNSLDAFVNHTWQRPVSSDTDTSFLVQAQQKYISEQVVNLGATWRPMSGLSVNSTLTVLGPTQTPAPGDANRARDPIALLNATVVMHDLFGALPGALVSVSGYNLTNSRYNQGGTVPPLSQPGLWVQGSLGYRF